MIGTREPPTFSKSQRYGSGFHGSPVVTNVRSDERSLDGSPCGSSARDERGREAERRDALLLDRLPEPVGRGQSGAPSAKTIVAAERADADDRPWAHDPAHVGGEVHDVALVHVGLVGGLARDRDEEAALHVHDALRLPGRARRVREEVRVLRVDLERRQLAGQRRRARTARARRARPTALRRASSRIASIGTRLPRRDDSRCVITTFASLASSRCATAGAAKPEKIGTCTAPMCAIACDATATSGDIGRKIATRSPGSTPSETSRSASRVTSRDSSAKLSARREPSSPRPTAASASGRRSAQRCTQFRAT